MKEVFLLLCVFRRAISPYVQSVAHVSARADQHRQFFVVATDQRTPFPDIEQSVVANSRLLFDGEGYDKNFRSDGKRQWFVNVC